MTIAARPASTRAVASARTPAVRESASVAARRVGYSHLSAFSKAFSAAHGMPPRAWLGRDAG